MAEQRFEGTSFLDFGRARRTMSIDGILTSQTGLALTTTGTTEQVVLTVDLSKYPGLINAPANNPSKWFSLFFWGKTAANGNNKQIRVYQTSTAGTKLADTTAVAGNAVGWYVEVAVFPSSATTADVIGLTQVSSTASTGYAQLTGLNYARGTGLVFVVSLTTASAAADATMVAWQVLANTEGGIQSASGVLL